MSDTPDSTNRPLTASEQEEARRVEEEFERLLQRIENDGPPAQKGGEHA